MNYKTWHITHRFNKSSVLMSLITSIGRYIVASRGSSSAANHMFSIAHQKCEYLCKISGFVTLLAGALRCVLTHSQVGNTLAVILKGQLMLPITLSRVLRSLPNNLKSTLKKVNHEWKTFKTAANLSRSGRPRKFNPSSHFVMLRETAK